MMPVHTLDEEIDAWEQEREREHQACLEERARQGERVRSQHVKEDDILRRLLGTPGTGDERPPTRWSKPASHLQFFAESEFLNRPQRLIDTIFSPDRKPGSARTEPESEQAKSRLRYAREHATSAAHGQAPSPVEMGEKDHNSQKKKPRPASFRRSLSSLQVIAEGAEEDRGRGRAPGGGSRGKAQSVGRESRGESRESSRGGSRPTSTDAQGAARILFSAMKGSPWSRSATPQVLCPFFVFFPTHS